MRLPTESRSPGSGRQQNWRPLRHSLTPRPLWCVPEDGLNYGWVAWNDVRRRHRRDAVTALCCVSNRVDMAGSATQEIDAIISKSGDWRGEMLSRLRGIVLAAGPAVVEEVKWKKPSRPEGVPVWSLNGIVCIGEMLKNAVRLTFPKGAQLKDPQQLFNARLNSGSVSRHRFL